MKNVIVTGATRGLGLAIVEELLKDDRYFVIGSGRKETPEFSAIKDQHADRIAFESFDLENLDAIPEFVKNIQNSYGAIYGLVNNAGLGADGVLATQHQSDIERVIKVNLEAPILLTKYACRTMLMEGEGRIINISSIIASTGFSGLAVYGATKSGLEGFTRSLSRELGKMNITVNCIAPGYMETDMTAGLEGPKLESIRRRAPLGLPLPEDVASAALYLLSDGASKMTGAVMTIDGGSTA